MASASRKFDVPRTTISDYSKKNLETVKQLGAPKMLSDSEEAALVEYLLYMSDRSMPLRRCDLRGVILVIEVLTFNKSFSNQKLNKYNQHCHMKLLRKYNKCNISAPYIIILHIQNYIKLSRHILCKFGSRI